MNRENQIIQIMKKCFIMFLVFLAMLFAMSLLNQEQSEITPQGMVMAKGDTTKLTQTIKGR